MDTTSLIYQYMLDYKKQNDGNYPSVRRICRTFGIASTNTVHQILHELIEAGKLEQNEDRQIMVVGGLWLPPA